MHLNKAVPSLPQQSSRLHSDIIQPWQPPCYMLSICTTLPGVGASQPFSAFRVATGIRPWGIAQTQRRSPVFLEKRKARGNPVELAGARGCKSRAAAARNGHKGAGSTRAPSLPSAATRTASSGTEGLCARGSPMALLTLALRRGHTAGGMMAKGFRAGAPATQAAPPTNPSFTLRTKWIPLLETFPRHPAVLGVLLSLPGCSARHSRHLPFPHRSPSPCYYTLSPPKFS